MNDSPAKKPQFPEEKPIPKAVKATGGSKPAPSTEKKMAGKSPPPLTGETKSKVKIHPAAAPKASPKVPPGKASPPPGKAELPRESKKEVVETKRREAKEGGEKEEDQREKKKKEHIPAHLRRTGMSLPMKATLVTSMGLAVLLVLFGIMVYVQVGKGLEETIDKFGINTAKLLASIEPDCWQTPHGTDNDTRSIIHRFIDEYGRAFIVFLEKEGIHLARGPNFKIIETGQTPLPGEGGGGGSGSAESEGDKSAKTGEGSTRTESPQEESFEVLKGKMERMRADRVNRNYFRIKNLTLYADKNDASLFRCFSSERDPKIFDGSDIRDAWVTIGEETLIKAQRKKGKEIRFTSRETKQFTFVKDGVTIETPATVDMGGFSEGEDQSKIPCRVYSYPVYAFNNLDKKIGNAYVLITERKILDIKEGLLFTIAISTVIILAVGVVVSLFINKKLMSPIMELTNDIEIVSKGDLSHRTRVSSHDEIGVLARTFDKMTKNLSEASNAAMEHKAREHEVKIASEIKNNLLPKEIPSVQGFELSVYHNPSKEMDTDYYDFIPVGDRHLGIITGSVAGQGIPAFMIMAMARSLVRAEAERETSPAKVFCKVNATLAQDIRKGMYVSMLFAMLDKEEKSFTVASAGHGPMVVYRAKGEKLVRIIPDGISMGLDKGAVFNERLKEEKLQLDPGDRIFMHTQGVLKLANEAGEELGEKRLYLTAKKEAPKNSEAFLNILSHSVDKFLGKAPQKQDVTFVTLKRIA